MAYLMLPALALFLIDRKWSRVILLVAGAAALTSCMISVISGVLSGQMPGLSEAAFYAGMILIGASPLVRSMDKADEKVCDAGEDDIVNNRQKWRLIIAGYVIFLLFAVAMIVSIVKLNAKINTIYGFSQDLDKRIESLE
jgi:peptidoglycan/LPS O-acetylase OafA/YrhL